MWLLALWACKAPPAGERDTDTGSYPEREWVEVSTVPCARDADGYVECWYSEEWKEISIGLWIVDPPAIAVREFNNQPTALWGVAAADGRWVNLDYETSTFSPVMTTLQDASQVNSQCALVGVDVVCWDTGPSTFPTEYSYLDVHGEGSSHAALTIDNRVFTRYQGVEEGYDFELDPTREYLKVVHIEPWDACALGSDGVIDCVGPNNTSFDNPPYRDIAAGWFAACAVRENWEIECNYGYEFDFGPIRDIEVTQTSSYSLIDVGTPAERWFPNYVEPGDPPHICVITQDNHVRCEGWKFDFPDLQAALP